MREAVELLTVLRAMRIDVLDEHHIDIDVSAIARPNAVHVWPLVRDDTDRDIWHHFQAGTSGTLGDMIAGIAWCYVRQPDEVAS